MAPLLKLAHGGNRDSMYLSVPESQIKGTPGPGEYVIPSQFDPKTEIIERMKSNLVHSYEKQVRQ